jgi:hypothetical protein
MLPAIIGWVHALLIFALVGEADSLWLQIAGGAGGVIFAISGSMSAWSAARKA